jgi:imidazolonepropionase-like amidohydrolase
MVGPSIVKPMPIDIARAAVEEAHRRKMLVFAHPSDMVGATVAIDAGVDVLAHTNSEGWEPTLIDRLIAKRMALIPTLKLWRYELTRFGAPANAVDSLERNAVAELAAFVKAGGQVLFGTGVGYMTDLDPTDEYRLMATAGMSAMEILASLTTNPAARFGEAAVRGTVAKGRAADIVVLEADPTTDVTSFARVRYTIRAGQIVYGATPPSASVTPLPAP